MRHTPVLLPEVLATLSPKPGEKALDVTLGLGGHAGAMLKAIGAKGTLVALDADTENLSAAREALAGLPGRSYFIHANFGEIPDCLPADEREFDIIFADLGLSSPHVDDPARGFTFREDSPLDMRYDQTNGQSAAMLLASADRGTLAAIFKDFGEIRGGHFLVDAIIGRRQGNPVRTSGGLKEAALEAFGRKGGDLLPQIFQALRIAVNRELESLEHLLETAPGLLRPGGRFAVLTYHSLEDRLVKQAFKNLTTPLRDEVTGADASVPDFALLTKKPVAPSDSEVHVNPRSRSALLRAIRRTSGYTSGRPSYV